MGTILSDGPVSYYQQLYTILRDELTDDTYDVRPKLVINAAGPWIDFTNRKLGMSTKYIGLSYQHKQ